MSRDGFSGDAAYLAFEGEHQGREQLERWVETGADEHAVAVYGGSNHIIRRALETGVIDASPVMPTYLPDTPLGSHLYYMTPFLENLDRSRPDLTERIVQKFGGWSKDQVLDFMAAESVRRTARSYARRQSVENGFHEITGIQTKDDNILVLAEEAGTPAFRKNCIEPNRAPFDAEEYFPFDEGFAINADQETVSKIRAAIPGEQLAGILERTLQRLGVLIYFNEQILDHQVVPGLESEDEILVISRKPLTIAAISGIQLLSEADKKDLGL